MGDSITRDSLGRRISWPLDESRMFFFQCFYAEHGGFDPPSHDRRSRILATILVPRNLVLLGGFEPPTKGFTVPCSTKLSYSKMVWYSRTDSNRRHGVQGPKCLATTLREYLYGAGRTWTHNPRYATPSIFRLIIQPHFLILLIKDRGRNRTTSWRFTNFNANQYTTQSLIEKHITHLSRYQNDKNRSEVCDNGWWKFKKT